MTYQSINPFDGKTLRSFDEQTIDRVGPHVHVQRRPDLNLREAFHRGRGTCGPVPRGVFSSEVIKRLRGDLGNIVVNARRKGKAFWRPLRTGDAMERGPIKVTNAARNRYVF